MSRSGDYDLQSLALLLSNELLSERGLRCDDENLLLVVLYLESTRSLTDEIKRVVAIALHLNQSTDIDTNFGREGSWLQPFELLNSLFDIGHLLSLTSSQVGRLQPSCVVFVVRLALLVSGLGMRGTSCSQK